MFLVGLSLPKTALAYQHITAPAPASLVLSGAERGRLIAPVAGQDAPLTIDDQRHLLERTGFGVDSMMLQAIAGKSRFAAVDALIDGIVFAPFSQPPAWISTPTPDYWRSHRRSATYQQAFRQARHAEMASLRRFWLNEMAITPSPLTEKLALFWQDHFVASYRGLHWPHAFAWQLETFRKYGSGNFAILLRQMIRDPALLVFLDNNDSRKEHVNENFGRELLELFTMGEGQFSQDDMHAAASVMSGYSVHQQTGYRFAFHRWAAAGQAKQFMGRSVSDGDELVEAILANPQTARYIAAKFYGFFVSDLKVDTGFIDELARVFRQSGYDIRTLLAGLLKSEQFWAERNRGTLVKTPIELLVGTLRRTGSAAQAPMLLHMLNELNQLPFDQANVGGWPKGLDWITPASVAARAMMLDQVRRLTGSAVPGMADQAMAPSAMSVVLGGTALDGPPAFRVELRDTGQQSWRTVVEGALDQAHDTALLGYPRNVKQRLAWQRIALPDQTFQSNTSHMRIHFTNDRADERGDRNIWLHSLRINGVDYPPEHGETRSCEGGDPRSGALYCAGYIEFDLRALAPKRPKAKPAGAGQLSILSSHVHWASEIVDDNHKGTVVVTLEEPRLAGRHWHRISIDLIVADWIGGFGIKLSSNDCWPACLSSWPGLAEIDDETGERAVIFRFSEATGWSPDHTAFAGDDQRLIEALLASVPAMIATVSDDRAFPNPQRQQAWAELLAPFERLLQTHDRDGQRWHVRFHDHDVPPAMMMSADTGTLGAPPLFSLAEHTERTGLTLPANTVASDFVAKQELWDLVMYPGYQLK